MWEDPGDGPPPAGVPKRLRNLLDRDPPTAGVRTVGRGTDGHYCNRSWYIKHVSYTFNSTGGYTTLHVQPRSWFIPVAATFAALAWNTLVYCIRTGGPHGVYVRSWDAMEDQFLCRALGNVRAGISWDLEGHRRATDDLRVWINTRCNW